MSKLGSVNLVPIQSCTQYTAYNMREAGVNPSYVDSIRKALRIHFGPTYKIYSCNEGLWPEDVLRSFLVCGAYGTFPPITIPLINTADWLESNACYHFFAKTSIGDIRRFVLDAVPEISPVEGYDQESMYRAVNFLMCIRHDIQAAYMKKRNAPWNPLVSFASPFYYRKGEMRNWVLDNNILRAEIVEFIFTVYHFLMASGVIKGISYSFYLQSFTQEDIDRLKLFDYIKEEKAMATVCSTVSKMRDSLTLFDQMLRRLPTKESTEQVTPDNLLETLQGMFKKLSCMEQYCSSIV